MSLFPKDDLLSREIESWKAYGESLREEEKEIFDKMIQQCYNHIEAINVKGESYSTFSMMVSLVFAQHRMIEFLLKIKK